MSARYSDDASRDSASNYNSDKKNLEEKFVEKSGTAMKVTGTTLDVGGKTMQVAGKGTQAAGKTIKYTGKGIKMAGEGLDKGGDLAMKAGNALSSTRVGAVVGVPLSVVGGGAKAAGKGAKAAGTVAEKTGEVIDKAGKIVDTAGKKTSGAGKDIEKVGKLAKITSDEMQKNRQQLSGVVPRETESIGGNLIKQSGRGFYGFDQMPVLTSNDYNDYKKRAQLQRERRKDQMMISFPSQQNIANQVVGDVWSEKNNSMLRIINNQNQYKSALHNAQNKSLGSKNEIVAMKDRNKSDNNSIARNVKFAHNNNKDKFKQYLADARNRMDFLRNRNKGGKGNVKSKKASPKELQKIIDRYKKTHFKTFLILAIISDIFDAAWLTGFIIKPIILIFFKKQGDEGRNKIKDIMRKIKMLTLVDFLPFIGWLPLTTLSVIMTWHVKRKEFKTAEKQLNSGNVGNESGEELESEEDEYAEVA